MGWFLMLCDGSTLLEITGEAKDLIKLDGGHPGRLGEGREEGFREGDGGREGGGLVVIVRERYLSEFGNARVAAPWKSLYSCRRTKREALFPVFHETSIRPTNDQEN